MFKLWLRFYFLMLLAIILIFMYFNQLFVFNPFMMEDLGNAIATGTTAPTFQYIQQQLQDKPEKTWPVILVSITPTTEHYPITIAPITSLALNTRQLHRLQQGHIIGTIALFHTPIQNKSEMYQNIVYQRIGNSDKALQYSAQSDVSMNYLEQQRWLIHFIDLSIKTSPHQSIATVLQTFSQQYGVPLALQPLTTQTPEIQNYLRSHQYLYDSSNDTDALITLYVLYTPDQVLIMGPYHYPWTLTQFDLLTTLLVLAIISLLMFVSVYPFSRDLNKLGKLAAAYGEGDFTFDVKIRRLGTLSKLYKNLKSMSVRIQTLLRSHKELTQAVSHELKTPLSGLKFALTMIRDSKNPTATLEYLDSADLEVADLESLVGELLLYAQFDRQSFKPDAEKIDLATVLPAILKDIESKQHSNTTLHFNNLISGTTMIGMKQTYFQKLMENLLSNAYRYAKNRIEVTLFSHNQRMMIEVADDGPGIPVTDRQKIFEPFVSLDASRNKALSGHGLGLAIVKRIVEMHQGEVFATQSKSLKGAGLVVMF